MALVAPARHITAEAVAAAAAKLRQWGWQPVLGDSIGARHFQFAGDDHLRCRDLQYFLDRDDVGAILFARGGYGTARIVDDLNWTGFREHPKWLCGYSDITVLHNHVLRHVPVPTVHSLMAIDWDKASAESQDSLRKVLRGEFLHYTFAAHPLNRPGTAEGVLCGGNLSVLYSLLGSISFPDMKNKILVLEDLDEHLYHVDRMMLALRRAGVFEQLAALLVGWFTDMHNKDPENPFGESAYEIISRHVAPYGFPVCYGLPIGHHPHNLAVVMGSSWKVEVTAGGTTLAELPYMAL